MTNPSAAIKIVQKQLGLDDDAYRDRCERLTGKRSTTKMTDDERALVLADLRRDLPAPLRNAPRSRRNRATGRYAPKLQALWIAGWNLGVVRDRDDAALIAFVQRVTKVEHTRFLTNAAEANKAVEAIKAMLARDGGVMWRLEVPCGGDPYRVVIAQVRRLDAATKGYAGCAVRWHAVRIIGRGDFASYSDQDWRDLQNALGKQLRDALEGRSEAAA